MSGWTTSEGRVSARETSRSALVISPDEYFRLAMSGLLTNRLDFDRAFDAATSDFARDGEEAAAGIALVIVEPGEGDESGFSFGALRQAFPKARVVLISRQGRRDDILDGLRAGAHGCIPKHMSSGDVAQALSLILSGALWIPGSFAEDAALVVEAASPQMLPADGDEAGLTPRQREVLGHVVQGKSNKEIARLMGLREGTVKVHVAGLLRKLGVSNRSRAAALGSRLLVQGQPAAAQA